MPKDERWQHDRGLVWTCHMQACVFATMSPDDMWRHLWRWHSGEMKDIDLDLGLRIAENLGKAQHAFLTRPRGTR